MIGYFASAINVASSNPCVGHSTRIKISLFLLSKRTGEFISAPKIITFFPTLPSVNENSDRESNLMSEPLYLYLSGSAFLISSTDPNKQSFNVKSVFTYFNHGLRFYR